MHTTESRFAADMRLRRDELGMSQAALAEQLTTAGIKARQATIWEIEVGQRRIRLDEALAIARVLGFTIQGVSNDDENADLRDRLARIAAIAQEVRGD